MIEVGESVRTVDGKILKVDSFEKDCRNVDCLCFTTGEIYTRELSDEIIVNHSKNIIDLIELYDYINGMIVFDIITYDNGEKAIKISGGSLIEEEEIKDILTHEQFEQNCYKIDTN